MAALEHAGYTAVPDTHTPRQVVAIALRERTAEDREHLRSVLAEVRSTNMGGPAVLPPTPVRFLDEESGSAR